MKVSMNLITQSIRYSLVVSALATPLTALSAEDETVAPALIETEEQEEEEIELIQVTGSRIKQTSFEGPNPVTSISAEDMLKQGHMSLLDALSNISQNSGLVDSAEVGASGFTPGASVVNLRGLGPQYTLTLVNGRRLASYPAAYGSNTSVVSLSSIPMAAVERVDVLTTGASAVYGSDAVSGVINIILKKDLEGTDLALVYGTGEEHKQGNGRLQLTHGMDFDKGNLTLIGELQQQAYIKGGDLKDIDSAKDYPFGDPVMSRGAVLIDNWAAYEYLLNPSGEPTYIDPGVNACNAMPWTSYEYRSQLPENIADGKTGGSWGNYCGYDNVKERTLRPQQDKFSFMATGNYELGNDITGFIDVLYTKTSTETDHGSIAIQGGSIELETGENQLKVQGPDGQYLVMPDWYTVGRVLPSHEIGNTAYNLDDTGFSITVGASGYIGDHDWEVYFLNSENTLDTDQRALRYEETVEMFFGNYVKDQLGIKVYDGTGTHDLYQPLSSDEVRRLVGTTKAKNKTDSQIFSASIAGDLFELPAGNLQYAAVIEYANESFSYEPDELMTQPEGEGWWGLAGFGGFGERSRSSVGGELKMPITDTLSTGIALRYDAYDSGTSSDSGAFTPAYNLEFRPNDEWLFRASYARSFKAPDMQAIFTRSRAFSFGTDYTSCYENSFSETISPSEFISNQKYYSACLGSSFNAEQLPNKELKNEEGTSIGLGFVYAPINELTISFDYYDVEIRNQVRRGNISTLLLEDFHCTYGTSESAPIFGCDIVSGTDEKPGLVVRKPSAEGDFTQGSEIDKVNTTAFNLASFRQTGFDFKASYLWELDNFGALNFATALTNIISTEYDAIEGDDKQAQEFSSDITNREPEQTITASITYMYEDFTTTLSGRYMSALAPRRIERQTDTNGDVIYFDKYGDPLSYDIIDLGNGEKDFIVNEGYYQGEDARVVGESKRSNKRLDPYITANLTFNYAFNDKDTSISLAINNVFDTNSPDDDSFMATEWPWYDIISYSGSALGREYYLSVNHHF